MTSDDVVIESELLCFMLSRIDSGTPRDILLQLCFDFYEPNEIITAKSELISHLPATVIEKLTKDFHDFIKTRSGKTAKSPILNELYAILLQTDRDCLPKFVAVDLKRIPALNITHFDLAVIITSYDSLRSEIDALKLLVQNLMHPGATNADQSSPQGETSLQTCALATPPSVQNSLSTAHTAELTHMPDAAGNSARATPPCDLSNVAAAQTARLSHGPDAANTGAGFRQSYASMVNRPARSNGVTSRHQQASRNPMYKKKTASPNQNVGSSFDRNGSLKSVAAIRNSKIFVSRFAPNTTVDELSKHVSRKLHCAVKCEEIPARFGTYKSFKLEMPSVYLDRVLQPSFWPAGILFRKFYDPPSSSVPSQQGTSGSQLVSSESS